jgi:hypothetical protein
MSFSSSVMGQVRGGGRLYDKSPLQGYSEEEMVAEAKGRIKSNQQHRRLKQLLSAASEDGSTVATKDLLLAAKLAKMNVPEAMVADTPYATGVDGVGEWPARSALHVPRQALLCGVHRWRTRAIGVRASRRCWRGVRPCRRRADQDFVAALLLKSAAALAARPGRLQH